MSNSGRKPLDGVIREIKLSVKISKEEMERIEEIAKYLEIPKATIARNFMIIGLDEAELFRKIGILSVAKKIKKTSEGIKVLKDLKMNKQLTI